eukprot:TRINITY_DN9495_c0_g1_i3.p1 TRINITY_DN9495_c0_g1~~TRINITY_DN9495_c0_g1_i3.p1  ORF type:complete len:288 (-),score=74.87 TRINITY_DN9495_c0_g1_i3:402-1265(-)
MEVLEAAYSEQELEKKAVDLVDSALLFTVSFLLFSVFAKPLIKAVQKRIWNSRALKLQALVVVALIWWKRRDWIRKRVPKIAMVEDSLGVVALWLTRMHANVMILGIGLAGVAVLVYATWASEGFSWRFQGRIHQGKTGEIECSAVSQLSYPVKQDGGGVVGRTKMLRLPWNPKELTQLVSAIDEIRAKQRCQEQLRAPPTKSRPGGPACPSSCPPANASTKDLATRNPRIPRQPVQRPKAPSGQMLYMASLSSKVFHRAGCRHVAKLANKVVGGSLARSEGGEGSC